MPRVANNKALRKTRKQLSILFKNRDISETEESSESDSSGDLSHIPLNTIDLVPKLSNLSITQSTDMEQIMEQLRLINANVTSLSERQDRHEQMLNQIREPHAEQAQVQEQILRVEDFYRIPDPIKSLPIFDGNRKQLSAWLTTAEETLNLFKGRINDYIFKMYVTAVTNKIEGKAKDILCLAGNPQEFDTIKDILTNALGDRQELSTYKCQLWQHKMTDGMSIHRYYQRAKELIQCIKTLAKQNEAYKNNWAAINLFIDEDGLAAFIAGLKGTYFGHVQAARPKDIEDAYAFLCKFKSQEITANSMTDRTFKPNKQPFKPDGPFKSGHSNNQKSVFSPQTETEKPKIFQSKYNQSTPMEVDPSLRSRLTLNKKLINNTELESTNNESVDEAENIENNANFRISLPTTEMT